ncbi:MAG: AAA family ATPase [Polyangiales bacterium]
MGSPTMLGRARELERVRALLDDPTARLVSLRGPPGVGKSTLARALVASLRAEVRAVVSVSLDGLRERAEVLAALSSALAHPSPSDDPRVVLDRVARALDEGAVTLVLDGVDGAREALAAALRDLLDATERARVVACAWRRLGLAEEHVVALEPLAPDDATQLFRRRVAQLAPARRVTDDELGALVARTGGLPLAVEVVAARVASLGAAAVLASLDAHGLAGGALDRALDAAWEHLAPDDRRALAALSLFRAPFGADDAAALLARPDALDALERLVAASLVVADDAPSGPRFALLDGVRDHAARRLDDPRALARRHALAFARPRPALDAPGAWGRLAAARADLLAAWRWGVENDPALALRVALALDPLLVAQGPVALHREVLRGSLARAPDDAPIAARVDLGLALGRIDMIRGRARAALGPWAQAHALAERLGDPARVGWATAYLAVALRPLGRLDEARAHARRAFEAGAAVEDLALVAIARHALACVHHGAGDLDAADAEWERALATAVVARSPRLQGIMHANLARTAWDRGDPDRCARHAALARAALSSRDDRFHLARVDVLDGLLAARAGRHDEAAALLDRALDVATAHDDLDGALEIREALAAVALDRDDRELAARHVALFAAAAQVADDVAWPARVAALQARLRPVAAPRRAVLRLARDGRTLLLDGAPVDLARRGPLRRVLVALFEARLRQPGEALDTHAVLAAGWPGERMFPESGAARVYMAVRRLRVLGLDAVLTTTDGGYALDPHADAAWLDAPDCQAM